MKQEELSGIMLWLQKKRHTDVYELIIDLFNEQLLAHAISENISLKDYEKLNQALETIKAYKLKKDTKSIWRR